MTLFERILEARGIAADIKATFLRPNYDSSHDPFLLPDMQAAVERLCIAHTQHERITIYGDYDIDGLTATTLLLDALARFGFTNVRAFIPNRFIEGYGLTVAAIEGIAAEGADLIITVDCGSLSHEEIIRAHELGMDVIVTDHHNVAPTQPPAVAVINPKRLLQDHPEAYEKFVRKKGSSKKLYPFLDLAGVGVAFKLVQALQTVLPGIPKGQEKWLLDLVALGTVCDVVTLIDENRTNVFWGLKVLAQTRRAGLKALMAVAGVRPETVSARSLGFALGPRMNAAGRLETAQHALDMLTATDSAYALDRARKLDEMNQARRREQEEILQEAIAQAEGREDPVLVVSAPGWNHGIVGIVAARLLELYKKPAFVLAEQGDEAKGSARSYGDFSAADAIRSADHLIIKGGGHRLAAGVTLPVKNIAAFRSQVNAFYAQSGLQNQEILLLPTADADAMLAELDETLLVDLAQLEPFGNGNPQPVLRTKAVKVISVKRMGNEGQHVKLRVNDEGARFLDVVAFNAPEHFFIEPMQRATIWYTPELNEWQGRRSVEGRLLHIELLI